MKWLRGEVRVDPEGFECRVGALWTKLFLWKGYVIVVRQKIWMRDEKTWQRYLASEFWREHEHHHIWQEQQFPSTFHYLIAFVHQYVSTRSHDNAPLEKDADNMARTTIAFKKHLKKKEQEERSRGTNESSHE